MDRKRELNDEVTALLDDHKAKIDALLTEWVPSLIRLYEITDRSEIIALTQLKSWFLPELFGPGVAVATRWRNDDVLGRNPDSPERRKSLDGLVDQGLLLRHEWIQPIPKGATTRFKPPGAVLEPVTNCYYTPSESVLAVMPDLPDLPARVHEIVAEYKRITA